MRFIPIVLSLLVLAAHFLRSGTLLGVLALIGLLALLPIRRPWVARATQIGLVIGALEWTRTLVVLAMLRMAAGEPFARLVLILATVIAVTVISALLFESTALRRLYRRGENEPASTPDR